MTDSTLPTMSLKAKRFRDVYAALSFWELHGVQRVYIADYIRERDAGNTGLAAAILADINALGEVIDERDGTRQFAN